MKFSIIIPVRYVNAFLRESIEHIKQLDYADFEAIIVVDEVTTSEFNDDPRFKFVVSGKLGPGEKRNIGVAHCTGDIVVFLDDDAYPKHDWLTKAALIFNDPKVYALGAPAVTPLNAVFLEKCSGRVLESVLTSAGTVYRHIPMIRKLIKDYPTVNLFVRKEAFNKVGGFITEFWPGEDTKLCLDLIKLFGYDFVYDPEPIVYHHRRNVIRPHLKQISRYGQHRGQFARIFPETSRTPGYFIPSFFVLGLFGGPFVTLLIPQLRLPYVISLLMYFGLVCLESFKVFLKDKNVFESILVGISIILTHVVYGINFMIGLIKRPHLELKKADAKTGNYIEG